MKLILFGGVQGVGKTTLLSWLDDTFKGRLEFLDAGDLFRRYCYRENTMTAGQVEDLITDKLLAMPEDAILVAHWHYAVRRPGGFIPQICFPRLERVARCGKIKKVILISLEAPVKVILKRRVGDSHLKKRELSRAAIKEEVAADEDFLIKHLDLFSRTLGKRKVIVLRRGNIKLRATKKFLKNFFNKLMG